VVAFSVLTSLSFTEVRSRPHGSLYVNAPRKLVLDEARRLAVMHEAIAPHLEHIELGEFAEVTGHHRPSLPAPPSESQNARPGPPLSVVVPLYNEGRSVPSLLRHLSAIGERYLLESFAVDDASKDDTFAQLRNGQEGQLHVLHREATGGYIAAIRDGFRGTTHGLVLFLSPTAAVSPPAVRQLIEAVTSSQVVAAALFEPDRYRGSALAWLSWWLTRVCLLLSRGRWVSNLTPSVYMFRRSFLERILAVASHSYLHPYTVAAYLPGPHRVWEVRAK